MLQLGNVIGKRHLSRAAVERDTSERGKSEREASERGGWLAEKVQMRGCFWRKGKLSGKIGSETFMVKLGVKLSRQIGLKLLIQQCWQHVLPKLSLLGLHFD